MMVATRERELQCKLGERSGIGGPVDPAPVRSVLSSSRVSPRDKAVLRMVYCGAVHTKVDLHAMGYAVDTRCPLCGSHEDTLVHRLWWCNHHHPR